MSPEYVKKILPMAESKWDIKILFEKKPICTLYPNEATIFCQYYDLLCSKIHLSSPVQEKVIDTLMRALIYDMQYILSRIVRTTSKPFTTGEYLFKKFIDLLESSYPKNRNVSYYAEQLHITPKYLTFICKEVCKQNASYVINQYVLKDIEYLLKYSQYTIKEIAMKLDFPDLSFFGKYVKQHFKMPPKSLRDRFRQENTI